MIAWAIGSHQAVPELSEIQRDRAMARFAVLQPDLENGDNTSE